MKTVSLDLPTLQYDLPSFGSDLQVDQADRHSSRPIHFPYLCEFRRFVKRYRGHYKVNTFSCMDQYLCMAFAQLTYWESLRDIEICLRSLQEQLYPMGIRGKVSRSTLAEANETRDECIYADFAQVLIHRARELYIDEEFGVQLKETVYALDASTIDLCLSLFPWARFRKHKAAVKTHIWIAVSVYVLVAILKKRLNLEHSLYTILQVLSVTVFEKYPILHLFTEPDVMTQILEEQDLFPLFEDR